MKLEGLSLEQAPPFTVPYRFFVTAALFGVLSAGLMLWAGPDLLLSRWMPATLALTHGIVLGFIASVVFGALQQILPVLAGAIILRPRAFAWIIHLLWVPGVLALQGAFLLGNPRLFLLAAALLGGTVIVFVSQGFAAMRTFDSRSESVPGIKLSLLALLFVLLSGVALALGYGGLLPLPRPTGTNLHLMWGLLGWFALLIMAVAWQVVPMFQITPSYPVWIRRGLIPVLFAALFVRSLPALLPGWGIVVWPLVLVSVDALISLALALFALATLALQIKRSRKIADSHVKFWQLACVSLLLSILSWWSRSLTDPDLAIRMELVTGILFIAGFVLSVVTGMLYKIITFLVWFHLQGINTRQMMAGKPAFDVPHMRAVIPTKRVDWQLRIFFLALLALLLAVLWPDLFYLPAAVLWLANFTLMSWNFIAAGLVFRRAIAKLKLRRRRFWPPPKIKQPPDR